MSNCGGTSTSSLTERAIRLQINKIIKGPFLKESSFVPGNVVQEAARWLLSLQMTRTEREIAERLTKAILDDYVRRLRWVGEELEQSVFKRYGG